MCKGIFYADNLTENYLRKRITQLWETANFKWHTAGGNEKLYWHWSPNNDFDMNFPIKGWNEGLGDLPAGSIFANTRH